MPGYIQELRDSRTFDVNVTGGKAVFKYCLTGETDEEAAYDLVLATSPGTWFNYTRDNIDMNNRPSLGVWFPIVNYTLPVYPPGASLPSTGSPASDPAPATSPSSAPPPDGEPLTGVSISVVTESQHVVTSRETISTTPRPGQTAKDFGRLVGVNGTGADAKVDGVDIPVPVANITIKRTLPLLTAGYFRNLLYCCGKTNSDPWWLFNYEEAIFAGASGQSKGTGEFEMNYDFKFSPTQTSVNCGEGIVVPEKKGWNYLWVHYAKKAGTELVERPYQANVERVISTVDFNWLGI